MELHSLTKPQKSIWSMEQYFGESIASITGSVMFDKPVDVSALKTALNETVAQFDSLRIRIKIQNGIPMQYIQEYVPHDFEVIGFSTNEEYRQWIELLAKVPFDLSGDLYKIIIVDISQQIGFVLHLHHLTADAWTMNLLANSLLKHLKGDQIQTNSYLEYLEKELEYEDSPRRQKDKDYFLSCFGKCSEPAYISEKQSINVFSKRMSFSVSVEDAAKMQTFCDKNNISLYALFMNALSIYIYRIKGMQDFYIGSTTLNRVGKREKETAGVFINTVPVLFHIDETKNSLENILDNSSTIMSVFRHQKYQYIDFLKDIREKYSFTDRLYDVMLNYQNAALSENGVEAQWHFCGCQGESLNIHINDRQNEGVLHLDYDYQTELFGENDIKHLHEHLMNLIADLIENSEKRPQDLKMLSKEEYHRVVFDFNETAIDIPQNKCVHQLFEEQVAKTPDAVAVVFERIKYSYRQINEMANSLAHILRDKGINRNDIVALVSRRSYKVIVAQIAIMKAGGAYLPIDPTYPMDRINYMLHDAKCKIALVSDACIDWTEVIDLENDFVFYSNQEPIENKNSTDDLCYVIYTSGSTGLPKGTMLTHQNVANYINDNNKNVVHAIIKPDIKTILSITTIGFDIFVTESLLPLCNGKTVLFANDRQSSDQSELSNLILEMGADVLQTTPSKMQLLMMDEKNTSYLKRLNVIILGGEALEPRIVKRLKSLTAASIYNIYGPTETTVWSTYTRVKLVPSTTIHQLFEAQAEKTPNIVSSATGKPNVPDITIGKPIANTQIYILDKHFNPLPIGATGELCIAGAGVGRGYLSRPELTAEKFIPNPFTTSGQVVPKSKMYRTGDLARWREDSNIEYIGRIDNQVKIRGLRIELGEIESVVNLCPGVKQVAVVVKTDDNNRQYICAYYVGDELDIRTIKDELIKKIPQYMVPHFFIHMDHFPTTPSGKTDRNAFPAPDFLQIQSDEEYVAPVTEEEKVLTSLMERVLGIQRIGLSDNFFDIGGDSLKAIEFVSKAHYECFRFSLQDVFDNPTAASLLRHIADSNRQTIQYNAGDFADIHRLLENNKIRSDMIPEKHSLGNILITGATGWLGAHVLNEFLTTETGIAYCLVRGIGLSDSHNRLNKMLDYYFDGKYTACDRLVAICGDITEKIVLDNPIDTIIHCAANVKHYGSYQFSYDINVSGTKNIIALAKEKSARLFHISTSSVSGNSFDNNPDFPPVVFDESKLYIRQPLENVYVRSKFESEAEVLRAKIDGLDAAVIRVGNLANRRTDYRFQHNHDTNATLTKLKAFVDLGLFPEQLTDFPLEFSPVDDTAKAIVKLAQYFNSDYSIFHTYNHKSTRFAAFVNALRSVGIKIESAPLDEFVKAVRDAGHIPERTHICEAFINDMGTNGELLFQSNITVNNDFTNWHLNQNGFEWPDIDSNYLIGYINYFKNSKYLSIGNEK